MRCQPLMPTLRNVPFRQNGDAWLKSVATICAYCGERLGNDRTAEHLIPKSFGGASAEFNYLITHKLCNNRRGNLRFRDFVKRNPEVLENIERYFETFADNHGKFYVNSIRQTISNLL